MRLQLLVLGWQGWVSASESAVSEAHAVAEAATVVLAGAWVVGRRLVAVATAVTAAPAPVLAAVLKLRLQQQQWQQLLLQLQQWQGLCRGRGKDKRLQQHRIGLLPCLPRLCTSSHLKALSQLHLQLMAHWWSLSAMRVHHFSH